MHRHTLATAFLLTALVVNCHAEYRSYDGSNNNLAHPEWGQRRTNMVRMGAASYGDGISTPAGANRPNPRDISNAFNTQPGLAFDERGLSDFVWQWGQFIDHDTTLTLATTSPMFIDVTSPSDPLFPFIPMFRSDYDFNTGTSLDNPRQQFNEITSYLDASMVYGSDEHRADVLREHKGGRMKMGPDNLMMRNEPRLENDNPGNEPHPSMFLAGDRRANEQHGLIAMHTLFVREHNRIAAEIAAANPDFDDEELYQRTRKVVGGIVQHITYDEYLPALTGSSPMLADASYDANATAAIGNEFATAIFRLGHTQVSPSLARIDNEGNVAPGGPTTLSDAFFTPSMINSQEIDYLMKGMASQVQQSTDLKIVDELRNQLFGNPDVPSGGLDLLAININRGRDHGLPSLVEMQAAADLPVAGSFADITSDPEIQAKLIDVYGDVEDVDLWIGLMAEDHLPGSTLGPTAQALLLSEFERRMEGDRFFYLWDDDLTPLEIEWITSSSLANVIMTNSGVTGLQDNVFFVPEPASMAMVLIGLFVLASSSRSALRR